MFNTENFLRRIAVEREREKQTNNTGNNNRLSNVSRLSIKSQHNKKQNKNTNFSFSSKQQKHKSRKALNITYNSKMKRNVTTAHTFKYKKYETNNNVNLKKIIFSDQEKVYKA